MLLRARPRGRRSSGISSSPFVRSVLASAAAVCAGAPSQLLAGSPDRPYLFNVSSDTFFTFSGPSLNNHGTAAFVTGSHPSDALLRVAGADGIETTVLDTTGPFDAFGFSPDINDAGEIGIDVGLAGTSDYAMIRTRVGGPTTEIARTDINQSPGTFDWFNGNATINANGQVAFTGMRGDGVEGVFAGDGTSPPAPLASNLNGFYDFGEEAHLNNSGVAAFLATNANDDEGIFTAGPNGIRTVALATGDIFGFTNPSINNAGTVAFVAYGDEDRLYTAPANGGPLSVIASAGGTSDESFYGFDLPLINDNGDMVFFAELFNFDTGLFNGPDPVRDRIIMTGDALFGSTVEEVYLQLPPMHRALNNQGQVAVSYRLADGRHGVAIASPAPMGDANVDSFVNLADFNILAANFGQSGRDWWTADFTGDGIVNLEDFNQLAANFGVSAAGPTVTPADWAALGAAIPEPAGAGALVIAGLMCAGRRRRDER